MKWGLYKNIREVGLEEFHPVWEYYRSFENDDEVIKYAQRLRQNSNITTIKHALGAIRSFKRGNRPFYNIWENRH